MYKFPKAAVTNYYTLKALKQWAFILFQFGGRESEIRTQQAWFPLGGSEKESDPGLSFSFWWLLAMLGVPWLVCITSVSISDLTWTLPVCVYAFSPLFTRTSLHSTVTSS